MFELVLQDSIKPSIVSIIVFMSAIDQSLILYLSRLSNIINEEKK